jgi:hypothetical protein
MKRRFFGLTCVMLALALLGACGGDGDGGTGPDGNGDLFYRFDANGTRITYTVQQSLLGSFAQSGNQRTAIITGFNANSNSALQIYAGTAIGVGTYSGYTINPTLSAVVGVLMHYQDAGGVLYQSDGGAVQEVINITELNATTVRGTFTGRLKAAGRPDMVITNGEFLVRRN